MLKAPAKAARPSRQSFVAEWQLTLLAMAFNVAIRQDGVEAGDCRVVPLSATRPHIAMMTYATLGQKLADLLIDGIVVLLLDSFGSGLSPSPRRQRLSS